MSYLDTLRRGLQLACVDLVSVDEEILARHGDTPAEWRDSGWVRVWPVTPVCHHEKGVSP